MRKYWMLGTATAALLCGIPAVASAGPFSNAPGVRLSEPGASAVEKAARRCWWRDGQRYCGRVGRGSRVRGYGYGYGYGYYYGKPRPEELPTGSTAWWRAMDEEGRGGHGRRP